MKKAVHFGAGNIGRGFIGLILNQAGYEVCFADVSDKLIDALKAEQSYTVELFGEQKVLVKVDHVTGINSIKELPQLNEALRFAELITTAVGPSILPIIAKSLVTFIEAKAASNVEAYLNIIACENTIGGSDQIKAALYPLLSEKAKTYADQWIGFPNAAVDRIVPNQKNDDPLWVKVEPFYEWVIDQTQVKGPLVIGGVHFTDKLGAFIERKLFTVNTGHATAAYAAYRKGYATIVDAMSDPEIEGLVSGVIHETGALIVKKHGFDEVEQESYILKTIERFKNPHIIDEVVRVGRSPLRKLSPSDRFIKPLRECADAGLPTLALEKSIVNLLKFDCVQDEEAFKLQAYIKEHGVQKAVTDFSGLDPDHPSVKRIVETYGKA